MDVDAITRKGRGKGGKSKGKGKGSKDKEKGNSKGKEGERSAIRKLLRTLANGSIDKRIVGRDMESL